MTTKQSEAQINKSIKKREQAKAQLARYEKQIIKNENKREFLELLKKCFQKENVGDLLNSIDDEARELFETQYLNLVIKLKSLTNENVNAPNSGKIHSEQVNNVNFQKISLPT